jgi:Fe2+ transport system protein FeoA
MTLDRARRGQKVRIDGIVEPRMRALALRFGLREGVSIVCDEVIPTGAVVVRRRNQQLALGRDLARGIEVTLEGASA